MAQPPKGGLVVWHDKPILVQGSKPPLMALPGSVVSQSRWEILQQQIEQVKKYTVEDPIFVGR